jgi:hypothetical protein
MSPKSKVRRKKKPEPQIVGMRITEKGWLNLANPVIVHIARLTPDEDPLRPFVLSTEALDDLAAAWATATVAEFEQAPDAPAHSEILEMVDAPAHWKILAMIDASINAGYLREGPTQDETRSVILVFDRPEEEVHS